MEQRKMFCALKSYNKNLGATLVFGLNDGRQPWLAGKAGGGLRPGQRGMVWEELLNIWKSRTPEAPTVATLVLGPNTTAGESEY
jgi:hypothetical protein